MQEKRVAVVRSKKDKQVLITSVKLVQEVLLKVTTRVVLLPGCGSDEDVEDGSRSEATRASHRDAHACRATPERTFENRREERGSNERHEEEHVSHSGEVGKETHKLMTSLVVILIKPKYSVFDICTEYEHDCANKRIATHDWSCFDHRSERRH